MDDDTPSPPRSQSSTRCPNLPSNDNGNSSSSSSSSSSSYVVNEELENFFNPPLTTIATTTAATMMNSKEKRYPTSYDSETDTLLLQLERYRVQVASLSEEIREKEVIVRDSRENEEKMRTHYDTLLENKQREVCVYVCM